MVVQLGGQAHRSHDQRIEVAGQLRYLKESACESCPSDGLNHKFFFVNPVGVWEEIYSQDWHLVSKLRSLASGRRGDGINQMPNLLHGGRELLLECLVS